jgi:WD40 repeat protein
MLATATAWGDQCVKLWDIAAQPERLVTRWERGGKSLAFTPDGKLVASYVPQAMGRVQLREVPSGHVRSEHWFGETVYSLAVSSDGRTLAMGVQERSTVLWDTITGRRRLLPHPAPVLAVAFSPDGTTLASGSKDGSVQLWDSVSREEPVTLGHSGFVINVGFSADGKHLISATRNGELRLWESATASESARFAMPARSGDVMALDPKGALLASATSDRRPFNADVRLWDVNTGKGVAVLRGHTSGVPTMAFSPDGKTLATGSWDESVRLWDVAAGQTRAILTCFAHRVLARARGRSPRSSMVGESAIGDTGTLPGYPQPLFLAIFRRVSPQAAG